MKGKRKNNMKIQGQMEIKRKRKKKYLNYHRIHHLRKEKMKKVFDNDVQLKPFYIIFF